MVGGVIMTGVRVFVLGAAILGAASCGKEPPNESGSSIGDPSGEVVLSGRVVFPSAWTGCSNWSPRTLSIVRKGSRNSVATLRRASRADSLIEYTWRVKEEKPPGVYRVRLDSPQVEWLVEFRAASPPATLEVPDPCPVVVLITDKKGTEVAASGGLAYFRPDFLGSGNVQLITPGSSGRFEFCAVPGPLKLDLNTLTTGEIIKTVRIKPGRNEFRFR